MKTDELREAYLAFFETKGCVRRPSDVLVPRGDPSVLFTPAGMNQFKDQFLGIGQLEFLRATTCQKCLRTGDIENVGKTAYHHTFFEMMGNFSFGDYFKREAIAWAWEFLTLPASKGGLSLEPARLSATVYLEDDEAYDIWHQEIGLPVERLRRDDEHENFWPAGAPSEGPDGVCGPCSEIFYRTDSGDEVEIWNLVFTQFNRVGDPPDNLKPLPKKNIDTGLGLERTAAVLQGVQSNFEIDSIKPLVYRMGDFAGVRLKGDTPELSRLRRIADHARAVTFCIHENVFPGNEKQGYVVRRLLRRAVLDGYRLGLREPFLFQLVPAVVEVMQVPYPELVETTERVAQLVKLEEERFFDTLETGIGYLEGLVKSGDPVSGEDLFKLHATYGFPVELTEALAAERNVPTDRPGFDRLMRQHAEVSGAGAFSQAVFATGPLDALKQEFRGSEFLGYEATEATGEVKGMIAQNELVEEIGHSQPIVLVLDRSPFYGEAGGQVGDVGEIWGQHFRFHVEDTQRDDECILHVGHLTEGKVKIGDTVTARVDSARRVGIRRAHSATHLLHWALRQALGEHAQQAGSKVDNDQLRFDFTHPKAISPEELERIERDVNARVREAAAVGWKVFSLSEARKTGAMALFGEKYGDRVRVVSMGDFSREFCGGIHLENTGQIGLFRIVGEESVAAGTRRITALTGEAALAHVREQEQKLAEAAGLLRVRPAEVPQRVDTLLEEVRELKRRVSQQRADTDQVSVEELLASAEQFEGVALVVRELPTCDQGTMRSLIDQLRRKGAPIAILLAHREQEGVQLVTGLSRDLVERGLNASDWIKEVAKVVQGGGGGRPDLAQAGGKKPERLEDALARGVEVIKDGLGSGG